MELVNSSFKLDSKIGLKIIQRSDVQLNTGYPSQSGAHGCVQQGLLDGMLVAVKTPLQCSLTERDFKKFIDELTINASVRHPNCVIVVAACRDRADPMYVMEWMSGGSLHELLGRVPPPPMHVRLRNAREISSAVEYLHLRFLTHGDLKSLNVMLTSDLIAKVCDFGAAIQRLNSAMSLKSSKSHGMQGTIQWSAPELFHGASPNPFTDIYALGIIFWELAFCDAPFQSVNQSILMSLIKDGLIPEIPNPLPSCAAAFPPVFFDIMQRCWAKDPKQRPAASEVHRLLVSIDPSARPSAPLLHYPLSHPFPTASLLDCVRRAMPASAEDMLLTMMRQADVMFKSNTQGIQGICAQYGLLPIEANALTFYTMDGSHYGLTSDDSLYYRYNSTMRGRVAEDVALWADYSRIIDSALHKLPPQEITVYRGFHVSLTQVSHEFQPGKVVWLVSITSATTDEKHTLKFFGSGSSSSPGTLMKIHALSAKDIKAFSVVPKESELVFSLNTCLSIERVVTSQELMSLKGLIEDLPENVDLIVAREQRVSKDTVTAAVAKDAHDLTIFHSQNHPAVSFISSSAELSAFVTGIWSALVSTFNGSTWPCRVEFKTSSSLSLISVTPHDPSLPTFCGEFTLGSLRSSIAANGCSIFSCEIDVASAGCVHLALIIIHNTQSLDLWLGTPACVTRPVVCARVPKNVRKIACTRQPAVAATPLLVGASNTITASPVPVIISDPAILSPPAPAACAARPLSDLSVPDVALIVSSKGAAFEGYSAVIMSSSFGGDVIDMLDMDDVTQLMESMGIATNHRLVLKATFAGWKKNPDAAFEALAAAKANAAAKKVEEEAAAAAKAAAASRIAGKPSIHDAARNGNVALVKDHLAADPNCVAARDNFYNRQCTPLILAAFYDHLEICKLLISAKADVNVIGASEDGVNTLCWSAGNGRVEMCKLLISAKANVNSRDEHGRTPLSCCAGNGYVELCKLFISANANAAVRCIRLKTPLTYAIQFNKADVIAFLRSIGAPE